MEAHKSGKTARKVVLIIVAFIIGFVATSACIISLKTRTKKTPEISSWAGIPDSAVLYAAYTDRVWVKRDICDDYCLFSNIQLQGYVHSADSSFMYALMVSSFPSFAFKEVVRTDSLAFIRSTGDPLCCLVAPLSGKKGSCDVFMWLKQEHMDKLLSDSIVGLGFYKQPSGYVSVSIAPESMDELRVRYEQLTEYLRSSIQPQ